MHRWVDIELSLSNGTTATMHFILDPRLGETPETSTVVERAGTDEEIQAEIDRTILWDNLKVTSWKRKANVEP